MLSRVQRTMLWAVLALLAASTALIARSLLPHEWFEAPPEPPKPLSIELIDPGRAAPARPSRGMSIGRDGFGTVLVAPARELTPSSPPPPIAERGLAADPPVANQVAGLIRAVARLAPVPPSDTLVNFDLVEPAPRFGTLILRDGCLRLAEPGMPHAILPAGTKLHVDDEGFLTAGIVSNGVATNPRIGEPAWWPSGARLTVERAAVGRLRDKCGPGPVRVVGLAQGVAASQAAADGIAARNLVTMYGLPWPAALDKVRTCRRQLAPTSGVDPRKLIHNPCGSTPPSPVANPRSCPPETTLEGGLCRTAQGHVRPLPPL